MRQQIDLLETGLKQSIASNLKCIMHSKGFSQSKLSELSGIPQSTISDIIQEKFLVNAGKVQQIADALKVSKSDIDPSFKPPFIHDIEASKQEHAEIIKLLILPAHLDMSLDLIEEMYFEGKKLTKEDKQKIKKMIRILISNK